MELYCLGNRQFDFRVNPRFPKKLSREFLYVDLINNLEEQSEDRDVVLSQARSKLLSLDIDQLKEAVESFANMAHANGFGSGSIAEFLHERRDFDQLLAVVANDCIFLQHLDTHSSNTWTPRCQGS